MFRVRIRIRFTSRIQTLDKLVSNAKFATINNILAHWKIVYRYWKYLILYIPTQAVVCQPNTQTSKRRTLFLQTWIRIEILGWIRVRIRTKLMRIQNTESRQPSLLLKWYEWFLKCTQTKQSYQQAEVLAAQWHCAVYLNSNPEVGFQLWMNNFTVHRTVYRYQYK